MRQSSFECSAVASSHVHPVAAGGEVASSPTETRARRNAGTVHFGSCVGDSQAVPGCRLAAISEYECTTFTTRLNWGRHVPFAELVCVCLKKTVKGLQRVSGEN